MQTETKYFITNSNGFFVSWHSDIAGLETRGQKLSITTGSIGDDSVYVGRGTQVNATGLTSSRGNDSIYLTGTFDSYTQHSPEANSTEYKLSRIINIDNQVYNEIISFVASNGDKVYFSDGYINLDIGALQNTDRTLKPLSSLTLITTEKTPDFPLDSVQAVTKGNNTHVGETKIFISDPNGENISPGIKGSVLSILTSSIKSDTVYVAKGTQINAIGLTKSRGEDSIYLTGNFAEYTQAPINTSQEYKLSRMVDIQGVQYNESVIFVASNKDRIYFADGYIKIDKDILINTDYSYKALTAGMLDTSEITPGLGIGLRITDDQDTVTKHNITYTFTFDKAVKDFDISDIMVADGSNIRTDDNKGIFATTTEQGIVSGTQYTLVVTPENNFDGDLVVSVANGAANALTGTKKSLSAENTQAVDTKTPNATLITTTTTTNTSSIFVKSSEIGTAYLVHYSLINNTIGIKSTLDTLANTKTGDNANKVNKVAIVTQNTATALAATDLISGNYKLYVVDTLGNVSTVSADTIRLDSDAPNLISKTTGVIQPDEHLILVFNKDIVIGVGKIIIYDTDGTTAPIQINVTAGMIDSNKRVVTINPNSNLITTHNYYIKIETGAFKDTVGNDYAGITDSHSWTFNVNNLSTTVEWTGDIANDGFINAAESMQLNGEIKNINSATNITIQSIVFTANDNTTVVVNGINAPTISDNNTWSLLSGTWSTQLANNKSYTVIVNLVADNSITGLGNIPQPVTINTEKVTIINWTTNDPANGKTAFKEGDVVVLTLNANKALKLNTANGKVVIANKNFVLATNEGTGKANATTQEKKQLVFKYTVLENDYIAITDFKIDINAITLSGVADIAGNVLDTNILSVVELNSSIDGIKPIINNVTTNWGYGLSATEDNSNQTIAIATTGVENGQVITIVVNNKTYSGTFNNDPNINIIIPSISLQELNEGINNYTINVGDKAGNQAIEKIGAFIVDRTPPNLHATITPFLSATSGVKVIGDKIELTLTFNEKINGITTGSTNVDNVFNVNGISVSAFWSGVDGTNTRKLIYEVIKEDPSGALSISANHLKTAITANISAITDLAGNQISIGSISNIDSGSLTIDNTPPILVNVSVNAKTIILEFNEELNVSSIPDIHDIFTVVNNDLLNSISVSGKIVTLTFGTNVSTALISYTPGVINQLKDVAGNQVMPTIIQIGDNNANNIECSAPKQNTDNFIAGLGGNDKLIGLSGDDTLIGGIGNDILIGNKGDDVLTGGADSDTFVYQTTDDGNDVIMDFTLNDDKLYLGTLLDGYTSDSVLSEFVKTTSNNINTVINIDANGTTDSNVFKADVTITLQGITSDQVDLQAMINNGNLLMEKKSINVVGITSFPQDINKKVNIFYAGETIIYEVEFSDKVVITDNQNLPKLMLTIGSQTVEAICLENETSQASKTLKFSYTVANAHNDSNGISILSKALGDNAQTLATSKIKGVNNELVNLTTPVIASQSNRKVYTGLGKPTEGNDNIVSGDNNDRHSYIAGFAGNDTITAGRGNYIVTGGAGRDVFVWTTLGINTITDFTLGVAGDKLDLRELNLQASDLIREAHWLGGTSIYINGSYIHLQNIHKNAIDIDFKNMIRDGNMVLDNTPPKIINAIITRNAKYDQIIELTFDRYLDNLIPDNTDFIVENNTVNNVSVLDNIVTLNLANDVENITEFTYKPGINHKLEDAVGIQVEPIKGYLGTRNQDFITKNAGDNFILGMNGDDILIGGVGNDIINGGADNDILTGRDGSDILIGGTGNDTLTGGKNNDKLTGGEGIDTFCYNSETEGIDTITDFKIGTNGDKLDLSKILTTGFDDLSKKIQIIDNNGSSLKGDLVINVKVNNESNTYDGQNPDFVIILEYAGVDKTGDAPSSDATEISLSIAGFLAENFILSM